MTNLSQYFENFFSEKEIPYTSWELEDHQGVTHIIDSDVIIETIKVAPEHEQVEIRNVLTKLDFYNADITDFLKHLAQGMINLWAERKCEQ